MIDHQTSLATIDLLAEMYPRCFSVFEKRRRPLKLGMHHDLKNALNGAATAEEIAAALRAYCGNCFYLLASKEGTPRIDLSGNIVGAVTAEEAACAEHRLQQQMARWKRRQEAAKAKAEAEAKAQRNAGRISLRDLRAMAAARKAAAA